MDLRDRRSTQIFAIGLKNLSFLGGCDSQLHKVDISNGQSLGTPIPLMSPTLCTPNVIGDIVKRRLSLAMFMRYAWTPVKRFGVTLQTLP